jgi:hypothetical protein
MGEPGRQGPTILRVAVRASDPEIFGAELVSAHHCFVPATTDVAQSTAPQSQVLRFRRVPWKQPSNLIRQISLGIGMAALDLLRDQCKCGTCNSDIKVTAISECSCRAF